MSLLWSGGDIRGIDTVEAAAIANQQYQHCGTKRLGVHFRCCTLHRGQRSISDPKLRQLLRSWWRHSVSRPKRRFRRTIVLRSLQHVRSSPTHSGNCPRHRQFRWIPRSQIASAFVRLQRQIKTQHLCKDYRKDIAELKQRSTSALDMDTPA